VKQKKKRQIDVLREEYVKLEKRVTAKVKRNLKKGVIIAGTQYDPRISDKKLKKYNSRQLRAQMAKMEKFLSRQKQFIGGASGRAIDKGDYRAYVSKVESKNLVVKKWWDKVKSLPAYRSSYSIEEYVAARRLPHPGIAGNVHHALAPEPVLKPHQIKSPKAIEEHLKGVEKRMSKDYMKKIATSDWKSAMDMANYTIGADFANELRQLNSNQFMALWNYTGFANNASLMYEIAKEYITKGRMNKMREGLFIDSYDEARDQIKWALALNI
jgi:hypothetical protein